MLCTAPVFVGMFTGTLSTIWTTNFKLMFINVRPLYGLEESNNFSDIYLGDSTHNHNVDDIFIFRMASKLSFWILCVPNGTDASYYKERFNNKLCSVNQYFPAKLFIRRYLTDPE